MHFNSILLTIPIKKNGNLNQLRTLRYDSIVFSLVEKVMEFERIG